MLVRRVTAVFRGVCATVLSRLRVVADASVETVSLIERRGNSRRAAKAVGQHSKVESFWLP